VPPWLHAEPGRDRRVRRGRVRRCPGALPGAALDACRAEIWSALGGRADPGDAGWHIEGSFEQGGEWWVNYRAGMSFTQAAGLAAEASAERPAELVTGQAGDVFLCHPFLVQAASWPHTGGHPRIMAQPGVALHDSFPLASPLSPVERAIAAAGDGA
jgi:hypothetical protein